jgi:hypothetical protein
MAYVEVGYSTLAGANFISSLKDSFGTNGNLDNTVWLQVQKARLAPNTSPAWATRCLIGNTAFDASPGLKWSLCWDGSSSANTNWRGLAIPMKSGFLTTQLGKKQQFSQIQILTATGNFGQTGGPMVCFDPSDPAGYTAYELDLQTDGGTNWRLQRATQDNFSVLASGTGVSASDTWRLAADFTSASQTVLTVKQNGTVVTTFTDNTGSRLSTGVLGISSLVAATSGALEMRSFSGGIGL